jgi:transposase
VRVIDVFVDELDLQEPGFEGVQPEVIGRPGYHPGSLLKIYIYGYLNRIQSSRRLERETQRNVELIWLTGRLMPDFKTIADFRKNNGKAIRSVCRAFHALRIGHVLRRVKLNLVLKPRHRAIAIDHQMPKLGGHLPRRALCRVQRPRQTLQLSRQS